MSTKNKPSRRTQLLRAVFFLILVFCLGIVVGAGGTLWLVHKHVKQTLSTEVGEEAPVNRVLARLENRVASEAKLTETERDQLNATMNQLAGRMQQSRSSAIAEVQLAIQEEFSTLLDEVAPERRDKLRQAINKRLNHWGLQVIEQADE